jgi:hypothetical protein
MRHAYVAATVPAIGLREEPVARFLDIKIRGRRAAIDPKRRRHRHRSRRRAPHEGMNTTQLIVDRFRQRGGGDLHFERFIRAHVTKEAPACCQRMDDFTTKLGGRTSSGWFRSRTSSRQRSGR